MSPGPAAIGRDGCRAGSGAHGPSIRPAADAARRALWIPCGGEPRDRQTRHHLDDLRRRLRRQP